MLDLDKFKINLVWKVASAQYIECLKTPTDFGLPHIRGLDLLNSKIIVAKKKKKKKYVWNLI